MEEGNDIRGERKKRHTHALGEIAPGFGVETGAGPVEVLRHSNFEVFAKILDIFSRTRKQIESGETKSPDGHFEFRKLKTSHAGLVFLNPVIIATRDPCLFLLHIPLEPCQKRQIHLLQRNSSSTQC